MSEFEIVAEKRTEMGKGAMRRLRRGGSVPAVVYGGEQAPECLSLVFKDIKHQLENEAFYSHILNLKVDGKDVQVVLKDLQRHPATSEVTHVDLLRVEANRVIHMHVPLHFINEDQCPGRRAGGGISHHVADVEVSCLPKDLPEYIEVDMSSVELGQIIHLSELVLPEGVEIIALTHGEEYDRPVVSVQTIHDVIEEEELEEGAEVPEAGPEPEGED